MKSDQVRQGPDEVRQEGGPATVRAVNRTMSGVRLHEQRRGRELMTSQGREHDTSRRRAGGTTVCPVVSKGDHHADDPGKATLTDVGLVMGGPAVRPLPDSRLEGGPVQ